MHSITFNNKKYLVVRNLVSTQLLSMLSEYLWLRKKFNRLSKESLVNADMISREPILDAVLDFFTDTVSNITGQSLIPTYSFSRLYFKGAELPRHVDRPPCEVSCTIPLDYPEEKGWSFFTSLKKDGDNGEKIDLEKGDILIYKGEEVYHWREQLTKDWQTQLFVHYIDAQGTNQEWAFDKRPQLSMDLKRLNLFDGTENEDERQDKFVHFLKQQIRLMKCIYYVKKYAFAVFLLGAIIVFAMTL